MAESKQKIVPHLWFDKEARAAADFYTSLFPDSKVTNVTTIPYTPSGDCDTVSFELWGQQFMAISAGPNFQFNPSISFFVNFDPSRDKHAAEALDLLWKKLSQGGTPLMPLDQYPFSPRYGWIQDKFGLSWQIVPTAMDDMMKNGSQEQVARVTHAFLEMKKFDLAKLEDVFAER